MPSGVRLRYRIVDVFSAEPLAGNALCVVLDPTPAAAQQAIAREVNLSETTFPTVTGDDAYDVRIYTPGSELPFAGHPTIGTAWVLGAQRWTQTSPGATVQVDADAGGAVMGQPDPTFEDLGAEAADRLVAALGLPGAEGAWVGAAGGMRHVLVPTEAPIEGLRPDLGAVAAATALHGSTTLGVLRRLDDRTLHVRVFVPGAGIPEDPGTGSLAGPAATLAASRWGMATDLTIRQGDEIGRPCRIEVHVGVGELRVGGRVAACAEGTFTL